MQRSVGKEDRNVCGRCNKRFSQASNLKRHMRLHTGQFQFYCDLCKKGYCDRPSYNEHTRKHEGLRYYCEYCSKPFMSKQKYQYHLSDHTGKYRFWCGTCLKGFNVKPTYETHIISHDNQYSQWTKCYLHVIPLYYSLRISYWHFYHL